jgi:hypothetical protein
MTGYAGRHAHSEIPAEVEIAAPERGAETVVSVNLSTSPSDSDALALVPEAYATANDLIPLHVRDGALSIACVDPGDAAILSEVQVVSRHRVRALAAPRSEIREAVRQRYKVLLESANRATRKNIYVAAEARPIWERAEQLAGDSLSSLLTDLLREYISTKQAIDEHWEHIQVQVTDNPPSAPPTKAFWGRWIIVGYKYDADRTVSVAATRRGRFAFLHLDMTTGSSWLADFDTLDQAAEAYERKFLELVAVHFGRAQVEELDI